MTDERLSSLANIHIHNHKDVDIDGFKTVCWSEGQTSRLSLVNRLMALLT